MFDTVQTEPAAQQLGPVQPKPPHCPYLLAHDEAEEVVDVLIEVVMDALVVVAVVVVLDINWVDNVVDFPLLVNVLDAGTFVVDVALEVTGLLVVVCVEVALPPARLPCP